MDNSITIVIVEDDPTTVAILSFNLKKVGYNVIPIRKTDQILKTIQDIRPNLLIIDWILNFNNSDVKDGIDLCSKIRQDLVLCNTPIMMLSSKGADNDKIVGFEHGVDDYSVKPFSPKELNARIKALLRRNNSGIINNSIISFQDLKLDLSNLTVSIENSTTIDFALSEFRILQFFIENPNQILSRENLLTRISGYNSGSSITNLRKVDVHITKLRKLISQSSAKIKTIRNLGYKLVSR